MGIRQRHMGNQIALGCSNIHRRTVLAPRKFASNSEIGTVAHAGHGSQELFQSGWFCVEGLEGVGSPLSNFALRKPSSECGGEMAPKWIEPMVGHLKNTADVGWLTSVEKEIGAGSVVIPTIASLEEFQGYESVEEISCRSRVEPEAPLQRFEILRVFGKFREDLHLNSTQQCFRCPESEAHLQNVIRP